MTRDPYTEQGEPPAEWECGTERDGGRCSRPSGHKGMHRKRSMIGPSKEELYAAYEAGRAASGAQAVPPLDVERLLHAAIEREKRGTIRYAEDIGHDMGMAHAQDIIRRECAALHPENGPQSEREHAAWCYLPKDHPGMCEGDQ